MAREPKVTRTFKATICTVMVANTNTNSIETSEIVLAKAVNDEKKMFKEVSKVVNTDSKMAVKIVSYRVEEQLRGMTEQKFLENSEILPPRK